MTFGVRVAFLYGLYHKMNMKKTILTLSFILISALANMLNAGSAGNKGDILIEAESMTTLGGWCVDQQSMVTMGSPYLLAHGMGVPVPDASTTISSEQGGAYHLWVRTRDWTRTWGREESAGQFQVHVNGKPAPVTMGTENAEWHWQYGGKVRLNKGQNTIALHDLTGFDGRCDAIYLTRNKEFDSEAVNQLRAPKEVKVLPEEYDLVVVGGGVAGCCAAVSAARLGCKVALIQNRPVLGGNNSSEVRVGLEGKIFLDPYPNLGTLQDEFNGVGRVDIRDAKKNPENERSKEVLAILEKHPEREVHNAGHASNYGDDRKLALVLAEPNITLFLSTHVTDVETNGNQIRSVTGQNIQTGERLVFRGKLFADCTGDGDVGYLAGADYRVGREGREETGETQAPEQADNMVMGTSLMWYAEDRGTPTAFPSCPWALEFNEESYIAQTRGPWYWEACMNRDQIKEIEYIRDYALRSIYGNWDYLKNKSSKKEEFANYQLHWLAYIGGKRESRRLLGDFILCEQDVLEYKEYDDASYTTTWGMDLHYPKVPEGFVGDAYLAISLVKKHKPYPVPYRTLYSRNVSNLFMAGRNVSVTHAALGTVRVMRTTGMMGEIVGMAASICNDKNALPRDIYTTYLNELKALMEKGVGVRGLSCK